MARSFIIFSTLLFVFTLNAQDWCINKPAKLDKPPLSWYHEESINYGCQFDIKLTSRIK